MAIQVSQGGLVRVRERGRRFSSKQIIADQAEVSRSTVQKFFAGKGLRADTFQAICLVLELDWKEIVETEQDFPEAKSPTSIDAPEIEVLVKKARSFGSRDIEKRCGWMRVLDMTQPIGLSTIYTDVNILKKVTAITRREISELIGGCSPEEFDRASLGGVREHRVDGLETVLEKRQLMILGRPGSGKTTFLKRVAMLCNAGNFLSDLVPVFVSLKEFSETVNQPGLLNFISGYFTGAKKALELTMSQVEQLLEQGKALVLLDGLDEVLEEDQDRLIKEIRDFSLKYDSCHIVVTCRIAAKEYVFEQFTEAEIADFSPDQIENFVQGWFGAKAPEKADLFLSKIKDDRCVRELATNPLLLTLLCLEFDEANDFPRSRSELYERGLNILLAKWDGQRSIRRDSVYKKLSTKRKENMLGQLGYYTFKEGKYFFKEKLALSQVNSYISNLLDASVDDDDLLVDSRAVLNSVVAQHGLLVERARGIYSFSHLTFHEYFVAKYIMDNSDPRFQRNALDELLIHISEKRWREVFLLVAEGIGNADYLLRSMKERIDRTLVKNPSIKAILEWVEGKSIVTNDDFEGFYRRAYYFAIARDLACTFNTALRMNSNNFDDFPRTIPKLICSLDQARSRTPVRALTRSIDFDLDKDEDLDFDRKYEPELKRQLQQLRDRLPKTSLFNHTSFESWWRKSGKAWENNLSKVILDFNPVLLEHSFSHESLQGLQAYFDSCKLLNDCLNSECYVDRQTRKNIRRSLFKLSSTCVIDA